MTIKDFIEFIRPLTALNPDTVIKIQDNNNHVFIFDFIMIDEQSVELNLK